MVKKLLTIVILLLVFGGFYSYKQKQINALARYNFYSEGFASNRVRNLIGVREFMSLNPNGVIDVVGTDESGRDWVVHVYKKVKQEKVTFSWYLVDKDNGLIAGFDTRPR